MAAPRKDYQTTTNMLNKLKTLIPKRESLVFKDPIVSEPIPATVEKEEFIEEGAFARVIKGKWNDMTVAIKEMKSEGDFYCHKQEAKLLRELTIANAPNIVKYFHHQLHENRFQIIMEFIPGGDLFNYINNNQDQPLNDLHRYNIAKTSLNGLAFLHEMNKLHRDFKSENILLRKTEDSWEGVICDLGFVVTMGKDQFVFDHLAGSVEITAPELLRSARVLYGKGYYSKATDAFSAGITLNELAGWGRFACTTAEATMNLYLSGKRPPLAKCNVKFADLITRSWAQDILRRPSAQEMKEVLYALAEDEKRKLTI